MGLKIVPKIGLKNAQKNLVLKNGRATFMGKNFLAPKLLLFPK